MTYIAEVDPNSHQNIAAEAEFEAFTAVFPDWEISEGMGDRFIGESDFPVYDDSADMARVSNEDWEAMAEALYSER